jgi:hypothetical protein
LVTITASQSAKLILKQDPNDFFCFQKSPAKCLRKKSIKNVAFAVSIQSNSNEI